MIRSYLRRVIPLGCRSNRPGAGSATTPAATPASTTATSQDREQLDFGNTREAYKSKTFLELLRHYAVFKLFSYQVLVENNEQVSCYV